MQTGLFNLGINEETEYYLKPKIVFSNQIALVLGACGLAYTYFSIQNTPSLTIYPLSVVLVSLLTLVLNRYYFINFSRLLLTVMVPLLVFLYHGFLVGTGEPMFHAMFLLQFIFVFIPWVIFDFRESLFLFFVLLVGYALLLTQGFVVNILESGIPEGSYSLETAEVISYIFAFVLFLSCTLMLVYQSYLFEKHANLLEIRVEENKGALESQQNELKKTLDEVNNARKEDAKRNWVNEGLANLDTLFRGNYEEEIYQRLIQFIVKHLNVNQGGIFVLEQDEEGLDYLHLAGCYAYDRKKFLERKINTDEGLVGQAYMEKSTIKLLDIPENYISITSGLGDASPNCLLLVPIKNETSVNGVIELASFNRLEDHEIEFVEKAAKHIAAFIEDFGFNHRTQVLLEKTQSQAEEMKAQEEEMQQTMEEMQSIQEEMYRKEKEYINKIAELEDVLAKEKSRVAELRKYQ